MDLYCYSIFLSVLDDLDFRDQFKLKSYVVKALLFLILDNVLMEKTKILAIDLRLE